MTYVQRTIHDKTVLSWIVRWKHVILDIAFTRKAFFLSKLPHTPVAVLCFIVFSFFLTLSQPFVLLFHLLHDFKMTTLFISMQDIL